MKFIYSVVTLALLTAGSANAINLEQQMLGQVITGGPGCGPGTTSAAISEDGKAVEVIFTNYSIEARPRQYKVENKCLMTVEVKVPGGYEASLYRVDYESSFDLAQGSEFQVERSYSLNGSSINSPGRTAVKALEIISYDGHWYQINNSNTPWSRRYWQRYNDGWNTRSDRLQGTLNLQADKLVLGTSNFVCNPGNRPMSVFLHADTKIRLYQNNANEPSYAAIDRVNFSKEAIKSRYYVNLRPCR